MTITTEEFKQKLDSADAITIGDSPILTDWNLDNEGDIIDTKWAEDDLEYSCCIDSEDIQVVEKIENHYVITLPESKETITLMKITLI